MVTVEGLGSSGLEFKSRLTVELIPGGVDSACWFLVQPLLSMVTELTAVYHHLPANAAMASSYSIITLNPGTGCQLMPFECSLSVLTFGEHAALPGEGKVSIESKERQGLRELWRPQHPEGDHALNSLALLNLSGME